MFRFTGTLLFLLLLSNQPAVSDPFKDLWYDGNAEISVYKLTEARYGEPRLGKRILVYVTEPLRSDTLIKPDQLLPDNEKTDVIKLNDIRKFNTGIYDYSVMTSVFSSVDEKKDIPLMSALKVSFTSQEWCGNVFEILKRTQKAYQGNLYSYFEKDGETSFEFPITGRTEPEDNLWILVRELKGPLLKNGGSMTFFMMPSSWNRRKNHVKPAMHEVTLTKELSGRIKTDAGNFRTNLFTIRFSDNQLLIWVENEYPHRIIKWVDRKDSLGILQSTIRTPYWQQHDNSHLKIRKKLKLNAD